MLDRRKFLELPLLSLPLLAFKSAEAQAARPTSALRVKMPAVISTWDVGVPANDAAWKVLSKKGKALDAVEAAGRAAENEPSCCVGLSAWPDRDGRVTLDSCIMNGNGDCGAVAFLERIKHPVSVARKVMEKTPHVLLSGDGALEFARQNGFPLESAELSPDAAKEWKEWLKKSNYHPEANIENKVSEFPPYRFDDGSYNHDTVGTVAIDSRGGLAGMVTTSGLAFKMHGRVGDSPIIGAGLFVDDEVGAATATGVGEEVIRTCGTHTVIELMRFGRTPEQACREAIRRIVKRHPAKAKDMQVGFLALSKTGEIGAFSIQSGFTYSVTSIGSPTARVLTSQSFFA